MSKKIKVSIVGASGYSGGEILRILLNHPYVEIQQITSRKFAKFAASLAHPNLRKRCSLKFCRVEELKPCDTLFVCLPNGESQKYMTHFRKLAPKIIDLGADYRLDSAESYNYWYGEHASPEQISDFVYGIAELNRSKIKQSNYVACGGCEATCSILTLYPLFKYNLAVPDRTVLDIKMGSSGTGGQPSLSTHHPERSGVLRTYKPTGHRHTAEIEQELTKHSSEPVKIHLTATSVEAVRGILVTAHVFLREGVSENDIWKAYHQEYTNEPFVRLIQDKIGVYRMPEPKLLAGTNFCDIGLEKDKNSNRAVIVGAIDNLGKGTAGQAVQAFNIMYGFEETVGLEFCGLHPI